MANSLQSRTYCALSDVVINSFLIRLGLINCFLEVGCLINCSGVIHNVLDRFLQCALIFHNTLLISSTLEWFLRNNLSLLDYLLWQWSANCGSFFFLDVFDKLIKVLIAQSEEGINCLVNLPWVPSLLKYSTIVELEELRDFEIRRFKSLPGQGLLTITEGTHHRKSIRCVICKHVLNFFIDHFHWASQPIVTSLVDQQSVSYTHLTLPTIYSV